MRYANEQRNQWFEVMRLCCFQAFCSILDEKIHHCQGSELGICFLSKVLVRIILESSVCVQTAAKNFGDFLHKSTQRIHRISTTIFLGFFFFFSIKIDGWFNPMFYQNQLENHHCRPHQSVCRPMRGYRCGSTIEKS